MPDSSAPITGVTCSIFILVNTQLLLLGLNGTGRGNRQRVRYDS